MDPTPRTDTEALYRAAVGKNADYYVPKFLGFDAGESRASWNWPAFFITIFWMLYRRMYGWAAVYFLGLPFAQLVLTFIAVLVLPPVPAVTAVLAITLVAVWVVIPMYANALYHHTVRRRIAQMRLSAPSEQVVMDRLVIASANSAGPVIAAVAGMFILVMFLGILAAIAIPAYQDYTIRAQVTEGLNLASRVKAAVSEAHARDGRWPTGLADVELESQDLIGKYVEAIDLDHGTVVIQYGGQANPMIAGHTLTLRPSVTLNEDVVWACGWATPPEEEATGVDALPAGNSYETDIPPKYLPRACRDDGPRLNDEAT